MLGSHFLEIVIERVAQVGPPEFLDCRSASNSRKAEQGTGIARGHFLHDVVAGKVWIAIKVVANPTAKITQIVIGHSAGLKAGMHCQTLPRQLSRGQLAICRQIIGQRSVIPKALRAAGTGHFRHGLVGNPIRSECGRLPVHDGCIKNTGSNQPPLGISHHCA